MESKDHFKAIYEPMKALIDWAKEDFGNRGLYVVACDRTHLCNEYSGLKINIVRGLAVNALNDKSVQMLLREAIACVDEVQKTADDQGNDEE